MKIYLLAACLLLIPVTACSDSNTQSVAHDPEYQRQVQIYDEQSKIAAEQQAEAERQLKQAATQLEISAKQLKQNEIQAERMERLLERWEKQADRYDSILDKWEKQTNHTKK